MRRSVPRQPFGLIARWALGPVGALAVAACVWIPNATASTSAAAANMTRSGGSFDHCLLGSWRLSASNGSGRDRGDFVGLTMHVVLGHGISFGAPFGVMSVNLAGSAFAKAFGMSFRGTQSMTIVAGGNGSYGVLKMLSNKVVAMEGPNAVSEPGYVLGTLGLYKCTNWAQPVVATLVC